MDQYTKDVIQAIFQIVSMLGVIGAAIGVSIAFRNYQSQQLTKRAEWLDSLFERFYQKDDFKKIRKWYETKEIEKVINEDDNIVSDEEERITDYLNFFEFIASLEARGSLMLQDVLDLFEYYLQKIKRSPKSMKWIEREDYGFEKLRNLLNKIK